MKNRSMMVIAAVATVAVVAYADATRSTVDARLAESIHDIKKCGAGSWRGVFDWKAYDAVDWSKQEHSKKEWLGYEMSTVENLGAGVSEACKRDSDCKTVIGNVDTIVYKITDDDTKRLEASVSGHTLTFVKPTRSAQHADPVRVRGGDAQGVRGRADRRRQRAGGADDGAKGRCRSRSPRSRHRRPRRTPRRRRRSGTGSTRPTRCFPGRRF